MNYLHIKNLEKYQPKYKDGRRLVWIRWEIECMNDYTFSKLTPSQKWLFVGLICLETRLAGKLPFDLDFLSTRIGYPKNAILKDIKQLQQLDLLVTKCNIPLPTEHNITEHNRTKDIVFNFESLWLKYPSKVGKADAMRHFKATVKTEKDYLDIQTALRKYIDCERVKKGFIFNGDKWFKNWRDFVAWEEPTQDNDSPALKKMRELEEE